MTKIRAKSTFPQRTDSKMSNAGKFLGRWNPRVPTKRILRKPQAIEIIKPIHTASDYKKALLTVLNLSDTAEPDSPQMDRLEVLSILVEAYEKEHYPIDAPDPVEAIKFRMDQQGLERKDIIPILGTNSRVTEIFNHKRELTLPMITRLHRELGIPYESLMPNK